MRPSIVTHRPFVRVGEDRMLRELLLCVRLGLERHRRRKTGECGALELVLQQLQRVVRALAHFVAVARRSAGFNGQHMLATALFRSLAARAALEGRGSRLAAVRAVGFQKVFEVLFVVADPAYPI